MAGTLAGSSAKIAVAIAAGLLSIASLARSAVAEEPSYSSYERETIAEAKTALHLEVDPSPDGKAIEAVVLRPLDVLEQRDPLPGFLIDFLDVFHATSLPFTIERELLFHQGDTWNTKLVDESARNLRGIRQLSLVLIIPMKGSSPDKVRALVITKDIWSLRLNSDFRIANGGLEELLLAPSEENLGGLHHSAGLRFELEPDTYTFGASYKVPRIGASRLATAVGVNMIVGRESGDVEGTSGTFTYGQPLWSTQAKWQYVATLTWLKEKTRYFKGLEPLRYDADATAADDGIPIQWDTDQLAAAFAFARSYGVAVKHDVTFGVEASRRVYRPFDLGRFDPAAAREFVEKEIPLSDTRIYPYVGYATRSTDFSSYVDLNTLGLQEDYRSGHDLYIKTYPVLEALGSTRSFIGNAIGAAYTVKLGDGLARAYAEGVVEASPERVYDANLSGGLRVTSPRFLLGRLLFDGGFFERFENYLNRRSSLGGDGRLRGYPSGAYRGENVVAANLELRTRPFVAWTVQLAAAAFVDTGAAWDRDETPVFRQSIGTGIRILFPQLERTVMRVDWAVPMETDPSVGVDALLPGRFVVTFSQAFPMPAVAAPSAVD